FRLAALDLLLRQLIQLVRSSPHPLVASFHNKELDPPTHRACGSSSVNESLKCLLTSLRLPPVVVILTRWWWFLFILVHHFGIVLRWAIVVAALLRKCAT